MTKNQLLRLKKLILSVLILSTGIVLFSAVSTIAETDKVYQNLIIFADVINEIEKNYVDPVESDKIIIKAVQGMVRSLDPHSAYLDPEEYSALEDDTKGEFSGIGVVMIIKDNILTVISPIEGSPAYKAGIKAGDIIIKVNGESTHEMSISEAVNRIKGPKGSDLTITVLRKNKVAIKYNLTRADIPLTSVKSRTLQPGYAYISVSNFNENTSTELVSSLEKFEAQPTPLTGLILDLRGNPGGLLKQAVEISDLFINEGIIVSIKGRKDSETQIWKAQEDAISRTYPIVVLINSGSASASEIVAGALQEHKRALILGTTSFGKGSVQNLKKFSDGSALKLTVARYYTPSGRSIQAKGIKPDIELKYKLIEKEESKGKAIKESDLRHHLKKSGNLNEDESSVIDNLDQYVSGVIKTTLNMRETPVKKGKVLKILTKGSTVKIIEEIENEWLKVVFENKIGYIKDRDRYITKATPADDNDDVDYVKLGLEQLLLDNQVKRALELLVSHNIFSERIN